MNIKDIISSISKGSSSAGALATVISGLQQGYGGGALAGQKMTYDDYLAQKNAMQGVLTSAAGEGRMMTGGEQTPIMEALKGILSGNLGEDTTISPQMARQPSMVQVTPEMQKLIKLYSKTN